MTRSAVVPKQTESDSEDEVQGHMESDDWRPSDPEGEEPVRWDFASDDERRQCVNPPDENMEPLVKLTSNTALDLAQEGVESQQCNAQMQLEIHVEFNNGMWWHMPYYLSDDILTQ